MKILAAFAASALFLGASSAPVDAHMWSKDPLALAQDYLVIQDRRNTGDLVIILWAASPMVPGNGAATRALLDKYTMIAAAHVKFNVGGILTPIEESAPVARDTEGKTLKVLENADFPPTVVGALAVMQSVLSKSLGPFGQNIHYTVFDVPPFTACEKGGLRIDYAGTTYTYDTPAPGCH